MAQTSGNEKPAATLVCPDCGEPMVATRSGSGAVLLKCKGCKIKGRLTKFGVAEVPVRETEFRKALQFAIYPGQAGERARAQNGTGEKADRVTRNLGLSIEQASVFDAALDVYRQTAKLGKGAKGWQSAGVEWIAAIYLLGFDRADLDRYGVDDSVIARIAKIRDLSDLRKSQLSLIPGGDGPGTDRAAETSEDEDNETDDDSDAVDDGDADDSDDGSEPAESGGLPADHIEDKAERMNVVCEHAMRIAEDTGEIAVDTLRTQVCSDGMVCGNALKVLEKAGHLRKKSQRPTSKLIPSAKGRPIWVMVPTGSAYLRTRS